MLRTGQASRRFRRALGPMRCLLGVAGCYAGRSIRYSRLLPRMFCATHPSMLPACGMTPWTMPASGSNIRARLSERAGAPHAGLRRLIDFTVATMCWHLERRHDRRPSWEACPAGCWTRCFHPSGRRWPGGPRRCGSAVPHGQGGLRGWRRCALAPLHARVPCQLVHPSLVRERRHLPCLCRKRDGHARYCQSDMTEAAIDTFSRYRSR